MFRLVTLLALAICAVSQAGGYGYYGYGYRSSYYRPSYSYYQPVAWKYYEASWYNGSWYKAGYYAQINGQWNMQGVGPVTGDPQGPPPAPAPAAKSGLSDQEVTQLKELLKKLSKE